MIRTAVLAFLRVFAGLFFSLALTGCLGWGDMFAPQHRRSGDYSLIYGEDSRHSLYLMKKWQSVSVARPLHEIGWNQTFILFTDDNWPTLWNVIDVRAHEKLKITDAQREADNRFKSIKILAPTDAWNAAK
jgi:hypothetical protein